MSNTLVELCRVLFTGSKNRDCGLPVTSNKIFRGEIILASYLTDRQYGTTVNAIARNGINNSNIVTA